MAIPFDPRAALCTLVVLAGLGWAASRQMSVGFLGWAPMAREGRLPLSQGGTATPDVQRDIIGAVLLYEARRAQRQNVCLRLAPEGTAFEDEKRAIRNLERILADQPGERDRIVPELGRLRNPARQWLLATASSHGEQPLTEESARPLRLTESSLLGFPAAAGVDLTLDLARFPQFQSSDPDCNPLLFTAPAVAGELGFVDISYRCGPGCDERWLYAVALRESGWQVGALARTN